MASDPSPSALRAVIYARVSSAAQRDRHTIASQLSTLPTYISSRGWTLAKPPETYVDDGRTATEGFLSKRTSFTRLIHDASQGHFDAVVIVDLDRLTRSEDLQACSLPMFRSDTVDAKLWEAVITSVIREDHLEKAVAACVRESEAGPDPKELPRLEAKQKQLVRAEEILLERFGRGLITDSVLDKELVRLSKDRTAVKQSIEAAKAALRERPSRDATANVLRAALEDLRQKLSFATPEDRRDIVRAVLAKDENAVKIGPERIEARLLLAAQGGSGVAQVYRAG